MYILADFFVSQYTSEKSTLALPMIMSTLGLLTCAKRKEPFDNFSKTDENGLMTTIILETFYIRNVMQLITFFIG